LLDTDTCIYALERERGVLERLLAHGPAEIAVSVIKSPPIDHIPRGLRRPERRLQ